MIFVKRVYNWRTMEAKEFNWNGNLIAEKLQKLYKKSSMIFLKMNFLGTRNIWRDLNYWNPGPDCIVGSMVPERLPLRMLMGEVNPMKGK